MQASLNHAKARVGLSVVSRKKVGYGRNKESKAKYKSI